MVIDIKKAIYSLVDILLTVPKKNHGKPTWDCKSEREREREKPVTRLIQMACPITCKAISEFYSILMKPINTKKLKKVLGKHSLNV